MLVVTIVQHRTSVLDKTACVCSKTSRVEHTKNVHNRPKPAVFVRTAQGLSSNQNEVAINSKSGLWRTALLSLTSHCKIRHLEKLVEAKFCKRKSKLTFDYMAEQLLDNYHLLTCFKPLPRVSWFNEFNICWSVLYFEWNLISTDVRLWFTTTSW